MSNINHQYLDSIEFVLKYGEGVGPRKMGTLEVRNFQVKVPIQHPVIAIVERKLNYKFMLAEAIWILTGRDDVAFLTKHCKRMMDFSDDGITLSGAYGVPFSEQKAWVLKKLIDDNETRQAVMTFWNRCPKPSKDIPCTTIAQFMIRDNYLHMNVFMRSWDLWLGMPYDFFSFSMMATWFCNTLGCKPGWLTVTAGSAHIYDRDLDKAKSLLPYHFNTIGDISNIYNYGLIKPDSLIYALETNLNALNI